MPKEEVWKKQRETRGPDNSWSRLHNCNISAWRWVLNGSHFRDGETPQERKRPPLISKKGIPQDLSPSTPREKYRQERGMRWNITAQLKTPPTFRDLGKGKISKQAPKQNHSSLFSPLKRIRQRHSTFCNTLPAVPRVASNTAATEAGGKVPALCMHRALVPVVGTCLPGIRVVSENCSERTQHTSKCFTGSGRGAFRTLHPQLYKTGRLLRPFRHRALYLWPLN